LVPSKLELYCSPFLCNALELTQLQIFRFRILGGIYQRVISKATDLSASPLDRHTLQKRQALNVSEHRVSKEEVGRTHNQQEGKAHQRNFAQLKQPDFSGFHLHLGARIPEPVR